MGFIFVAVGALVHIMGANAQSIKSCGGPGDILQLSHLGVSPDPIGRHQAFTITVEGMLAKAFTGGTASSTVDLALKLFGQDVNVKKEGAGAVELEPAVPAGPLKLVIGPMQLPPLPGKLDASGRVSIVDEQNLAVACIDFDITTPLLKAKLSLPDAQPSDVAQQNMIATASDPTSCRKAGDHLTDISTTTSGGWNKISLTFDEDITQSTIAASIKVFVGKFPILVKMAVPVLYEPGVKAGELEIRTKPVPAVQEFKAPPLPHVVGDIVVSDGNNQEITCIHVDSEPSAGTEGVGEGAIVV